MLCVSKYITLRYRSWVDARCGIVAGWLHRAYERVQRLFRIRDDRFTITTAMTAYAAENFHQDDTKPLIPRGFCMLVWPQPGLPAHANTIQELEAVCDADQCLPSQTCDLL